MTLNKENKGTKCWFYKCDNCGHKNYFIYGGAMDIICRSCFSYNLIYWGIVYKEEKEINESLHPSLRKK